MRFARISPAIFAAVILAAVSIPVGPAPAGAQGAACPQTYTVRRGDTLSSIARRLMGSGTAWRQIYSATIDARKSDRSFSFIIHPSYILPGQKLCIPVPATPAAPAARTITIESPAVGDALTSPATIRGKVSITPLEKNLVYRVYDDQGNKIGTGPLPVTGELGKAGTFEGAVQFNAGPGGPGRIEVLEQNEAGGLPFASAIVDVYLGMAQPPETRPSDQVLDARRIVIASPPRGASVGNPFDASGTFTVAPFENTLVYRVYNGAGDKIGQGPITATAEMGKPGTFQGKVSYRQEAQGPGRFEILDLSAADGFVLAGASQDVLLGAPGASSVGASAAVTGTVTYLERMALPPAAQVVVQLVDVSRADAPAVLIGEQKFLSGGKQVPLPFELKYDPATIDPRFTYAVQATITLDGQLMFINTTQYLVITRGNPTHVDMILKKVG